MTAENLQALSLVSSAVSLLCASVLLDGTTAWAMRFAALSMVGLAATILA